MWALQYAITNIRNNVNASLLYAGHAQEITYIVYKSEIKVLYSATRY